MGHPMRDEFISDILLWTSSHERETCNSSVPTQVEAVKTNRNPWTIEKGGRRGSGGSAKAAQHDDNDDDSLFVCTEFKYF